RRAGGRGGGGWAGRGWVGRPRLWAGGRLRWIIVPPATVLGVASPGTPPRLAVEVPNHERRPVRDRRPRESRPRHQLGCLSPPFQRCAAALRRTILPTRTGSWGPEV